MPNKNKRQGSEYERLVNHYLTARGHETFRPRAGHKKDIGDIVVPDLGLVLQCKTYKDLSTGIRLAVDDLHVQLENAQDYYRGSGKDIHTAAAVVKRRRKSVERSYVVVELEEFIKGAERAIVQREGHEELFDMRTAEQDPDD